MPSELTNDVYDIGLADANGRIRAYLVDRGTSTLFDAGLEGTTDALLDGIEAVGVEPDRVVITHGDPDHVGGFDAVCTAYDVETWVPEETALDAERDPDRRYGHGDAIGRYEAVHVPGHTPGSSALVDEDAGLLVAGDALVGADWRGLPAGYLLPPPKHYTEDQDAAEENLDRLLEYEFDAALVYHGSSVTDGARERLDRFLNFPGRN